ncbi:MAG: radical SAM protein [Oligoflexia bacterium]|nr:radical SAM protein [Oligoflexia bacterium]
MLMDICLCPDVRLRQEIFGGLVFNKRTGTTVEVDHRAFQFLTMLSDLDASPIAPTANSYIYAYNTNQENKLLKFIQELFDLKIICTKPGTDLRSLKLDAIKKISPHHNNKVITYRSSTFPFHQLLSAPESVHYAITYRCNHKCPDCYAKRIMADRSNYVGGGENSCKFITNELDTNGAMAIIDKIVAMGVFQLAIGGGSPFIRTDLEKIIPHASRQGLVVHLTTELGNDELMCLPLIVPYLSCLQIGINSATINSELSHKSTPQKDFIEQLFIEEKKWFSTQSHPSLLSSSSSLLIGANLMLNRTMLEGSTLENSIEFLMKLGFKQITLLRYKPPYSVERWQSENPRPYQFLNLEGRIAGIKQLNSELNLRIDCGLSFLEQDLTPEQARFAGFFGCVAGGRTMAVAPDGSIYPCSQLVSKKFCAGNLLKDHLDSLWKDSTVFKTFRNLRNKRNFRENACGTCLAKEWCSGCRVFAHEVYDNDPGCPKGER